MDDGRRRCALPGCGVEIQIASGRPERRYCSAEHRAAARQVRRATRQRVAAADRDLAGALPWLREPAVPAPRDPEVRSTGPVLRPAARYTAGAVESRVESGGSRAESRVVVSRAAEPGIVARAAADRSRDRRHDARPRGRRALAMIGVAGILAGGYAATARPESSVPVQTAPDGRPGGESADTWAQRATVALAAVNTQLDTLARAEDQWKQLPASRTGVVPAPVAALGERRTVLERRRATLQSQLDTYRSLRETQQDLADSEQDLGAVERALADTAPRPRRSAEEEAALAALDDQRDLRVKRRDAQRAELESIEDGVSTAARTPLPDDGAVTDEVNRDVLEVVRNGGPQRRDDRGSAQPEVAPPPDPTATPRREPGTSEPAEPRDGNGKPRNGATERPSVSAVPETSTREPSSVRKTPPSPSGQPASVAVAPGADVPDGDVVAQLHDEARRVAREARRAEAERRAARDPSGTAAPAEPTLRGMQAVPRDGARQVGTRRAAPGRHRAPEKLQVTRIAIRAVPGGLAVATANPETRRPDDTRADDAGERAAPRSSTGMDDDAIEERNADHAARSSSGHAEHG